MGSRSVSITHPSAVIVVIGVFVKTLNNRRRIFVEVEEKEEEEEEE
jgi:heme exporter protein D